MSDFRFLKHSCCNDVILSNNNRTCEITKGSGYNWCYVYFGNKCLPVGVSRFRMMLNQHKSPYVTKIGFVADSFGQTQSLDKDVQSNTQHQSWCFYTHGLMFDKGKEIDTHHHLFSLTMGESILIEGRMSNETNNGSMVILINEKYE